MRVIHANLRPGYFTSSTDENLTRSRQRVPDARKQLLVRKSTPQWTFSHRHRRTPSLVVAAPAPRRIAVLRATRCHPRNSERHVGPSKRDENDEADGHQHHHAEGHREEHARPPVALQPG